ncbi:MAG: hypothetical protein NTV31_10770 [Bacteroidia bacterium]|nr:hypothetical protein [Bacteroidia bacterium]
MSENTTSKNTKDNEIDLLDLFQRIGRTFYHWGQALVKAFLIAIVFLLRRWLPLGLSIATGIGVSYIQKSTSPSLYTSDMVLKSNMGPTSELISYINRLQTYSTKDLSEALALSPELFGNIENISAFWIIDKNKDRIPDYVDYTNNHNVYDTTNIRMQDQLDVRVITKSPQELEFIRDGVIRYINSDSLFQQRNRLRLKQNIEWLKRVNTDILQLDSLQKVKYFEETRNRKPQNGGQMIFLQEQKTQLVYTDIHTLYYVKRTIEPDIGIYSEIVTVLSDFSVPSKRVNGVLFYGRKIIPKFFIFALLILILFANRKKLSEIYKRY